MENKKTDYQFLTRNNYNMFDMSSLLQKSIRRGDYERAGFAAFELCDRYRNYLWKRLLVISAEDCFGIITKEIVGLRLAEDMIHKGKEEKDNIFLSKAITLLCYALKNRDACYFACNMFTSDDLVNPDSIEHIPIEECKLLEDKIPDYVFDVHTLKGKKSGEKIEDMIVREQKALTPHQVGLFDDPNSEIKYDWNKYLDAHYKTQEKKYNN